MIRVGIFLNVTGQVWLGGTSYFRNLLTAVAELPDPAIQPVLLTGTADRPDILKDLPGADWRCPPSLQRFSAPWAVRKLLARVSDRDPLLQRDLAAIGVDVLSHSGHLGPDARIPTAAWIPDFQHKRLPQNYTPEQLRLRDRVYAKTCRYASRIIVSSHNAQRDLEAFYPEAVARTRVLQFVASVPDPATFPPRASLEARYGFSGRYFFLPNQFWVHKNHRVVIDALSVLRGGGEPITVLASGSPADGREPGHFVRLMAHARACGVADSFRVLGLIPYSDLIALMWHAVAVINPSRFEGWSTTVEEAKSLGVPAIVSDIGVHREQQPAAAAYFSPDSPEQLADVMRQRWVTESPEARDELRERARQALPGRRAAFARQFESCVVECFESGRNR